LAASTSTGPAWPWVTQGRIWMRSPAEPSGTARQIAVSRPDELAATTGLDAITHAIEAFVSRAASFLSDEHALAALRLARTGLFRSLDSPRDQAARTCMARVSMMAGLAFTNALLGITHALSHQVGGALDLPHGMLNAILLPHSIRFNAEYDCKQYLPVAEALPPVSWSALRPSRAASDRTPGRQPETRKGPP
jgi:alcohol dehydrogenase